MPARSPAWVPRPAALFESIATLVLLTAALAAPATAQDKGRVPVGVLETDFPTPGQLGISYRYSRTVHDEYLDGSSRRRDQDVLATGYSVVAERREIDRHTLGLRYSPHPRWTLALDVPWVDLGTDFRDVGGDSRVSVDGIGDVSFGATVRFMKNGDEELYLGLITSAPTGDYRETGLLEAGGAKVRLPYPVQPGSGTWSLIPVVTYLGQHEQTSWGLQYRGVFWLDSNDEGYRPGDRIELTTWIAQSLGEWIIPSLRLAYSSWGNYRGSDSALDPTKIPSANPKSQMGRRLDLGPGLQLVIPGVESGRFAIELLWPLYQHLDGPQLDTESLLHAGWRWTF